MPVWQACEILGEPTVMRIGSSLLRLRESANKHQQPQGASSAASTSQPPIGIANYSTNANAAAVVFEQEMQTLTAALFYQPPIVRHLAVATIDPLEDPTGSLRQQQLQQQEPNVPTHIAASWKRWLKAKALQLDKATLLPFLVPHSVQPSSAGHIGLFDCLVYALQGHANNNKTNNSSSSASTSYYGSSSYTSTTAATANNNTNNIIWIPDVLILLAICKQYSDHRRAVSMRNREQQQQQSNNNDDDDEKNDSKNKPATKKSSAAPPQPPTEKDNAVVWTMAVLTYRIFDSYMKNGTVTRDTVHRFMTDIYGDESYKRPNASALLDAMFYNDPLPPPSDNNNHPSGGGNHGLQANVTEAVFCRRCLDTVRPETGSHLLLDWLAVLGNAMLPLPRIPASITAYLEAMNYTRPPLCQVYDLADHRLYEIKRRFHSMVQQQQHGCMASSSLIQGDPMTTSSTAPEGTNGGSTAASLSSSSLSSTTAMDSAASRQVISQGAFCHAISSANEEMGTGGYLPVALATLVFRAGLEGNDFAGVPGLTSGNQSVGWGLYQVIHFGCIAVRLDSTRCNNENSDLPLLRFVFCMFQLPILDHDTNTPLQPDLEFEDDKNVLSRRHVSNMLLGLVEHLEFRRQSDCNALDIDEDDGVIDCQTKPDADFEAQSVNLSTAAALNLVQPPNGSKPNDTIQLRALTDACMAYANAKDRMTFDEFCSWSKASVEGAPSTKKSTQTRLASLILELRLIAGVKFGVPPTSAGVEVTLIAEIERRHKKRYPHSEVSRRGPRGTVWNIIDAAWFKEWATLVNKVMGTRDDSLDGRGDPRNDRVRGLSRISNTSLLVENGSLSIRPDIRWKHDYELIPPLAWSALQAWYDGGPPIHRSVVKYIENSGTSPSPHSARSAPLPTENEIELYPYFVTLYLCDSTSRGEARPFQQNYQMSRVSPIIVMLVQLSKELDVSPDSLRLWVIGSATGAVGTVSADTHDDHRGGDDWILSTDLNIVEQRKRRGVSMDISITLLLEIKDRESGLWPRGADGKDWTFRDTSVPLPTPTDLGDGVVGLYNMG